MATCVNLLLRCHRQCLLNYATRSLTCSSSNVTSLRGIKGICHNSSTEKNGALVKPGELPAVCSFHTRCPQLNEYDPHLSVVIMVTYEELLEGLKEKTIQMLDVRKPDELKESGTIDNAVNIPVQEMEEAVGLTDEAFEAKYGFSKTLLSHDNLVVYCNTGKRANRAAKILHMAGYPQVRCYQRSFSEWQEKHQKQ